MKQSMVFLKDVSLYWYRNQAGRLSAALTFYTLASLTPMMVLLLAVAGLFFNPERAATLLTGPVSVAIGAENTFILQRVIDNAYDPKSNITAGLISAAIIVITGSELFRQLGFTLNTFWQTPDKKEDLPIVRKILSVVGNHLLYRLRAFVLVLGAGLLMLVTLILSAGFEIAENLLGNMVDTPYGLLTWGNRAFTFLSTTLLFALIFRYIPKLNMSWRSVRGGALVTAVLFVVLQHLFGLYLSSRSLGSAFGAAGSLVVMLFWVYYTVQGMFFGAAWVKVSEIIKSRDNMPR